MPENRQLNVDRKTDDQMIDLASVMAVAVFDMKILSSLLLQNLDYLSKSLSPMQDIKQTTYC
jgi:hypothetical protein